MNVSLFEITIDAFASNVVLAVLVGLLLSLLGLSLIARRGVFMNVATHLASRMKALKECVQSKLCAIGIHDVHESGRIPSGEVTYVFYKCSRGCRSAETNQFESCKE